MTRRMTTKMFVLATVYSLGCVVTTAMGETGEEWTRRGTPIDVKQGGESSSSSSLSVETLPERTSNYFATYDETELFDALRERTVVLALLVPHCDLCRHYAEEFRYVAQLFGEAEGTASGGGETPPRLTFVEVPDATRTPNATAAFEARNAPFVAVLKKNRWYYVTPRGDTVIRPPKRYEGELNARETVKWLNFVLGRDSPENRVVVPENVDELTGENIDAYAQDEEYDVLIEFYAKWCGHCQAFEETYEQIGAHFARERRTGAGRVKVGRLDVDTSRPAALRYNITGLPTVQLFPRQFKKYGITYKASTKTTQRIIDFVKSPEVALAEIKIRDMETWACFNWLRDEGLITPSDQLTRAIGGEGMSFDDYNDIVSHVFRFANKEANNGQWYKAMIITMCMAETPQLKSTASGNAAEVWNLLDNAKFHVENAKREESVAGDNAPKHAEEDDDVDWEAVRREQAEIWRREREKYGLDDPNNLPDDEWFDFASPEEGGARVEVPEDAAARDEL
jgi:thiol-disulfide isomerase/thioredoxin